METTEIMEPDSSPSEKRGADLDRRRATVMPERMGMRALVSTHIHRNKYRVKCACVCVLVYIHISC